ncbi:MAG TPA: hypothetical protein VF974_06995 [Patescibacteria group bacterium]
MSNVNGNDIDDLFKRASDKYPLRTDSANWDKVAADLDKDRSLIIPPANTEGGDRRRRRRFFWLFLLLPLGGVGYYAWHAASHNNSQATSAARLGASQQAPSQAGTNPETQASAPAGTHSAEQAPALAGTHSNPAGTQSNTQAPAQAGVTPGVPASAQEGAAPTTQAQQKVITGAQTGIVSSIPAGIAPVTASGQNHIAAGNVHKDTRLSDTRLSGKHPGQPGKIDPVTERKDDPVTEGEDDPVIGKGNDRSTLRGNDRSTGIKNNRGISQPPAAERDPVLSALNYKRVPTTGGVALDVTVKANNSAVAAKDSSGVKKVKNNRNAKNKFLYAGLIVAPDLSMVKFQSVKGMGTTFGILLGYQFNRKWAIETGAYLDHKKYYTDGEYFKGKAPSNPNWYLLNVDGSCNMWEIPINVRYNLSSGEKTKWFATAGLSTYLMTSEHYVSTYSYNGNTWPYPWDTTKPSHYWFSVLNLSIGFDQKLGKIGNLRLEPYVRIPLSGMGSGSLPIMSAGLNIGITRRIW